MTTIDSFSSLAIIPCATKRADIVAGKRGGRTAELSGLFCTPLDPVDSELATRAGLSTPLEVWQTFIEGDNDIVPGDALTVASVDYDIRAVWDYSSWNGLPQDEPLWKWIILEEVKSS